ncbi:hypothetical protein [uncultured Paraglaciecola sp.]|uniref:hypothetical protein n=1 Tax=uncultured Paraglaciecola sp. TaxID=1765024 RepID=UPI0026029464|nr:hypothetical protein [uncultured Paraglaciecola sp.]
MSNIDYVINLCFDISEQGKTPTVALIRNIAQQPLTIPDVIKGLQHWKSNPSSRPKIQNEQQRFEIESDVSLQQRVVQLENQVATIMQQLAQRTDKKSS